jgi:hypothetical protein
MNVLKEYMIPDLCNIVNQYLLPNENKIKDAYDIVIWELGGLKEGYKNNYLGIIGHNCEICGISKDKRIIFRLWYNPLCNENVIKFSKINSSGVGIVCSKCFHLLPYKSTSIYNILSVPYI